MSGISGVTGLSTSRFFEGLVYAVNDPGNVKALLVIGGYLMRFFSLFKPGPKK